LNLAPACGIMPGMRTMAALGVLPVIAALAGGCHSDKGEPNAAALCDFRKASSACLRCSAQKCAAQFDSCYGAGFHSGKLIGAPPPGSGGSGGDTPGGSDTEPGSAGTNGPAPACFDYSRCVQTCGCFDGCFTSCGSELHIACDECTKRIVSPCLTQLCAAECLPGPDAGGS
jgi:hypothetical protein